MASLLPMHWCDLSTSWHQVSLLNINFCFCDDGIFVMQALAERRKMRTQSGGSITEVLAVPEAPVVPAKDAKARVRFAVEEGEAPGDRPLDPEVLITLLLRCLWQDSSASKPCGCGHILHCQCPQCQ